MLKKIQKITLYALLVYAILGFVILPLILKSQLIAVVEKETSAKISIDSISFNPFIFKLKLNEIELFDEHNATLASLKSLSVNVEVYSLLNAALHLKSLVLEEPKISLVYTKDKEFNFASIVKKSAKEEEPQNDSNTELPRIILDKIAIVDGGLHYEDFSHESKFDFSFDTIGFELKDIDTADFNTSKATLRFYTALGDGGFLDFKSEILGFKPLALKGSVDFEASKLYTEWKYMQDMLNLEVADGKINFNANYYINVDDLNATTIQDLNIAVSKLRIKPKNKYKDVLNIERFEVSGVTLKPMQQAIHVERVALDTFHIKIKRDEDKRIDWQEYIATNSEEQNRTKTQEPSTPWKVVVDDIALQNIKLDFNDAGIMPNVETKLNELNLYLQNVTLAGVEPLLYQMDLRLNEEFHCASSGDVKHKVLDVNSYTKCSSLDITRFTPYIDEIAREALSVYNVKLGSATLGFDANVSVQESQEQIEVSVNKANVALSGFALDKRSTQERVVDFRDFNINDISVSTAKKVVNIENTTLNKLNIKTKLYKDATLNLENLIAAKESQKEQESDSQEQAYTILLKHFALDSAKVSFADNTLEPALTTTLDKINVNAYNIDSSEKSWLNYDLSMRLNSKGYMKAKGSLRHTPLKQKGSFDLEEISLKEFSPYIEKNLYLIIDDGYVNLKTKLSYEENQKEPDLKVSGDFDVNEFFLFDSRDNSTLLSFNTLALHSFDYEMFPDRAFVNELDLDGFYVNAIIDEEKNLNFASLAKETSETNTTTESKDENSTKFPFKVMKLNIASGSAKFADLSLPLKFKTDIHNLNGAVYSISSESGEVSYVDIVGEVDKYGSTKLLGSIDSSNPKLYTDLDFNFRNLELSSLSGYSASFAGYEIESGKLFLDLGYDIVDSELLGKNSIIIKNIKLGKEIEDENISSLPLGFAIALLEDSDGIIDIDMPVEGNIDEPDFKYGALVWKTFGNLIIKAVASPFRFLGSMLGLDGEELEYVEFEVGSTIILPPEKEKLDNITKLMIKRPKISLKITGQYDDVQDTWMLKKEKLITLVMQKSGVKNRQEHQNAMNVALLEEIYEELAPEKKAKDIEKGLQEKYKDDALKRVYLNALIKESTQMQEVSVEELQAVANKRAEHIRDYLVGEKGLEISRIALEVTQNVQEPRDKWVNTQLEVVIK